jgi:uncharacterized protein YceK
MNIDKAFRPGMRFVLLELSSVLMILLSGCGFVAGWSDPDYCKVLVGTRADLEGLSNGSGPYMKAYRASPGGGGPGGPHFMSGLGKNICVIAWLPFDLPISFGMDMCLLPVALLVDLVTVLSPPSSDERQSAGHQDE